MDTLENLLEKDDKELRTILNNNPKIREEEITRLSRAMINLKSCRESIELGRSEPGNLFWDSWERHHHAHHKTGASPRTTRTATRYQPCHNQNFTLNTSAGSPNESDSSNLEKTSASGGVTSPEESSTIVTPSPSPPNSPSFMPMNNKRNRGGFPTTPPPKIKLHTIVASMNNSQPISNNNMSDSHSLTKSKSDESQLLTTLENNSNNHTIQSNRHPNSKHFPNRARLQTDPDLETVLASENDRTNSINSYIPPQSPATPNSYHYSGGHNAHRFTKKFRVMSTCYVCNKQMFFGLKCKECKFRCHKDCESNAPKCRKSCVDEYPHRNPSPILGGYSPGCLPTNMHRGGQNLPYHCPDSSSAGSSCNSSTPSSPAPYLIPQQSASSTKHTKFSFEESNSHNVHSGITLETRPIEVEKINVPVSPRPTLQNQHQSNDSDKTVSTGSTSASTDSDHTPKRLDSTEERESVNWRQNSISLKEWDIPYDDLKLLEKIGQGRFGTVHRALWHGDVAVKVLKEDYLSDERTLEAFKLEVATFKKTRHDNVVLFMGACMKPPRLAIITSLCKGNTLYTHIHLRKDKFNLNRTTLVAQQISQGMGYLHARGIVHKDLKTKNIFLENGKVIITDFGLFSATKLCYGEYGLGIPQGWLCYLAPELIRRLLPYRPTDEDLPFSKASDVYAFGTVWYELLCGEFPFKSQSPEAIIWQVGRGMKQTLANLQASRDVKDILMLCWSFQADDRPAFTSLMTLLEKLPKKRLARSPSHPVQLSRSAESVF